MRKIKKGALIFFLLVLTGILPPAFAFGAAVDVYAEGSIIDEALEVYIYADVSTENLLSFGVGLNYNPSELVVLEVEKDPVSIPYSANGTRWYLGGALTSYRSNPQPDVSEPGKVVIVGGKLDPANPGHGVDSGSRLFMAKVTFGPAGTQIPKTPVLSLAYARGDGTSSYKNFVRLKQAAPEVLDGTGVRFLPVVVRVQGDADANGVISPRDINALKLNMGRTNAPCYMDCDGNGRITPSDINCIKSKI